MDIMVPYPHAGTPEISTKSLNQKCQFTAIFIRTDWANLILNRLRSGFLSAPDLRPTLNIQFLRRRRGTVYAAIKGTIMHVVQVSDPQANPLPRTQDLFLRPYENVIASTSHRSEP
jgi:hypothetical protein